MFSIIISFSQEYRQRIISLALFVRQKMSSLFTLSGKKSCRSRCLVHCTTRVSHHHLFRLEVHLERSLNYPPRTWMSPSSLFLTVVSWPSTDLLYTKYCPHIEYTAQSCWLPTVVNRFPKSTWKRRLTVAPAVIPFAHHPVDRIPIRWT